MNITKIMLLAVIMISLSGCGSSGEVREERVDMSSKISTQKISTEKRVQIEQAHKLNIAEAPKINRANWNGVVELTDGLAMTNDEELLSFKIQSPRIADGTASHHSIFIDSDNNANTGYSNTRWHANLGAEYLIDGNTLFRYAGAGWNWVFVSRIDTNVNANLGTDELELEFNTNLIETTGDIRVAAYLINNSWSVIQQYNSVNYSLANNQDNNQAENSFTIRDDDTTVTFNARSPMIADGTASHHSIFIDSDNNANTGYSNTRWHANLGAEYLIDGNSLFRYTGAGWNWEFVSRIDTNVNANLHSNELELRFNKNLITTTGRLRATTYLINDQWNVIQQYDTTNHTLIDGIVNPEVENSIFTITDNADTISLNMQSPRIENATATNQSIFIDVDNNPNTGYSNSRWNADLGAEYLIDGNRLFRYAGTGWRWDEAGEVTRTTNNNTVTITISKNTLNGLTQIFRATSYLQDNHWAIVHRYDTISHVNEDVQLPGNLSVSHDLNFFTVTIDNDAIGSDTNSDIYIDADNDVNTGFRINGLGAEYRVVNGELTRYRMDTRAWVEPVSQEVRRVVNDNGIVLRVPRWRIRSRRTISVMANLLDDAGNIIHRYDPIEYEVRGADDEITLSLDNPDFYIFSVHSPLIGNGTLAPNGGGEVNSLHLSFDGDNNRFTGNPMNSIGAEYYILSDARLVNSSEGRGGHWSIVNNAAEITVTEHTVEFRIPRELLELGDIFSVSGTLNHGTYQDRTASHFYWMNRYEFSLN